MRFVATQSLNDTLPCACHLAFKQDGARKSNCKHEKFINIILNRIKKYYLFLCNFERTFAFTLLNSCLTFFLDSINSKLPIGSSLELKT